MKRRTINYLIDMGMAVAFLLVFVSGLLKYRELLNALVGLGIVLPTDFLTEVHRVSGLALSILVFAHLVLHWKWLTSTTRSLLRTIRPPAAEPRLRRKPIVRRRSLTVILIVGAAFVVGVAFVGAPVFEIPQAAQQPRAGRGADGTGPTRVTGEPAETAPRDRGSVRIAGVGDFTFDPADVETVRSDLFRPGHFSVFDVLVHLDRRGQIDLAYHFDRHADTHVIDSINGTPHWWYRAFYEGGWSERNVFRMDYYPYKDGMTLRLSTENADHLETIRTLHRREYGRYEADGSSTIVDLVTISGPNTNLEFRDVEVSPHDLRHDLFAVGTVTALDVILSLSDQGRLTTEVEWVESIGRARVQNYFVERIGSDARRGRCGFVYEAGPMEFHGFRGNHIHLPADARAIRSPDYVEFFWICV